MTASQGTNQIVQILPKSQITIPLAPNQQLSDATLFEDAQDRTKQYYLPRYRLATERVSGQQHFLIELRQSEQGGKLTLTLEKYPAPELGTDFRDATELSHLLTVKLQFSIALGNANRSRKEMVFSQIEEVAQGVRATLNAGDLNQLTQIYQAMTEPSYESVLWVERFVEVAIPQVNLSEGTEIRGIASNFIPYKMASNQRGAQMLAIPLPQIAATSLPNPRLRFVGVNEINVRGERYRRFELRVDNWNEYPDELFAPSPDLPPCGLNKQSARTWLDILDQDGRQIYGYCALSNASQMQKLYFSLPIAQNPPPAVTIALRDRRDNRTYKSNNVATAVDTSTGHGLQISVPTRSKATNDEMHLEGMQLYNVSPGDKISLLLEFPDLPQLPVKTEASEGVKTRLSITNLTERPPSTWIQPIQASVSTSSGVAAEVELAQLYAMPDGRVVGIAITLNLSAQEAKRRLRSLLVGFSMPQILVSFPMAANQVMPITRIIWQNLTAENETFYKVGLVSSLPNEAMPLVLDPAIHPYVYQNILVDRDQHFGLSRYQEEWQGRQHFYFQDEAERHVVYYLPDIFKLGRKSVAPYTPDMQLYFDKTETGAMATLRYHAMPVVNPDRLNAVETLLVARMRNLPTNLTNLTFKPLLVVDQLSYQLALPRGSSDLGPFQERQHAQVNLRDGIEDAVTLDLEDFLTVFDSLLTPGASMFDGRVELMVNGEKLPSIRVLAKIHDLFGELLSFRISSRSAFQLEVTMRNETESLIRIHSLATRHILPTGRRDLTLSEISFPVDLTAGEALTFVVGLAEGDEGTSASLSDGVVVFDQSGIEVLPDHQSVWEAIVDPVIQPEYDLEISVSTSPGLFERNQIWALQVIFPHLISVTLNPDAPETKVKIGVSIQDYVLNRETPQAIRYQLEAAYETYRVSHEEWQNRRGTFLHITDADLPVSV